jgi:Cu-Zn family superoxide dismutase
MNIKKTLCTLTLAASCLTGAYAAQISVPISTVSKGEVAKNIGHITFKDSQYGLLVMPELSGLTPGLHGLHIHVKPSCADNGKAAGSHLDPSNSGQHLGPYSSKGHLGDLPVLYALNNGKADVTTLAPRLTVKDIEGHSIMVHAGGDNYSDIPAKLGGGGARLACGVIK